MKSKQAWSLHFPLLLTRLDRGGGGVHGIWGRDGEELLAALVLLSSGSGSVGGVGEYSLT